jgi:prevent-host-death family protein
MKAVSIKEARQRFAELIETAQRGTPIAITRRGRKVAELTGVVPSSAKRLPDLAAFRASLKSAHQAKGGGKGSRVTIEELRRAERA